MKHSYLITIGILLIFLNSCLVLKNNTKQKLLFELQTTSCYGTCPVYILQIYTDGTTYLQGIEHMDKIGNFKSNIDKDKLADLIDSFEKASFFEFKDSYISQFLDLPTKYITYNKGDQSKKIMVYDNIPKELSVLIKKVESLVHELEWKKSDISFD